MEKTKLNKKSENRLWEIKGLIHRSSEKLSKERRDGI